jgi:preprotein translocase subunit YajC
MEHSMTDLVVLLFFAILFLGGYWVFVLMPRQRDFQKRQRMARDLAAGDEVITGGGIVGKVKRIDSEMGVAYVEIADGIEIRVITAAILDRYNPEEIAKNAQIGVE